MTKRYKLQPLAEKSQVLLSFGIRVMHIAGVSQQRWNSCTMLLGAKADVEKYTHLQINLVFTKDSIESLVYDILKLNVLHTGRLMIQLA
ncbi:hypothetical protein T265_00704 [Opisthorchis viverrini]|uniref:Uncharacterized protein n=1 Tax=Opisthorchis viverrini TaxID=6198 RepID=A0A075AJH3_OPIVI|nr:hypothetical protein T265_00704 [Opisthorchis viverrini]KER33384.1 hypothetical protein T265_00704 [Opisthorchis viverrini]